jgi:two-component system, OmpR family, alkaline phosphatase synthesis response regulator PhoP
MPHILIVDDDPIQRMLVREVLADDHSLIYAEVEDGTEALEQARADRPDVIILDVMLPSSDGFEICRELKGDAILRSIPVILLTARYQDDDARRGREAGADALITKPFDPVELQTIVRKMLSQKSQRA